MDVLSKTLLELQLLNTAFHMLGCKWSPELRRVVLLSPEDMPHPHAPEDYRGHSLFTISVKPSGLQKFRPKPQQLMLLTAIYEEVALGLPCFIVILKARQIGFTTLIALLILALSILKDATNAMVAAHIDDSAYSIFEIYKRAYHFMPEDLRPKKEADNMTALKFEENQSSMRSFVAKEGSLGVSKPHTYAHFSEYALWRGDAGQTLATALDSIAKLVGTLVFIETTSRGRGNSFYKIWKEAAEAWADPNNRGVNRPQPWRPFFASWMDDEEYRLTPPPEWVKSKEEIEFQRQHNCDDAQLYWRNRKISEKAGTLGLAGATRHFNRENPTTAEDAFEYSGDTSFDAESLDWLKAKHEIRNPNLYDVVLAKAEAGVPGGAYPVVHPNTASGKLRIFAMPQEGQEYILSADPSRNEGKKPDDAAFHILNARTVQQVAAYSGKIDPYDFGDAIVAAGLFFNTAFLVVENNNAGLGTNLRITKELRYPAGRVYYAGKPSPGMVATTTPGFSTTKQSKPELLTNGQRYIKELRVVLHDTQTFDELASYRREWDDDRGEYIEIEGNANNLVMSLLIGLFVGNLRFGWFNKPRRFLRSPAPVKPEEGGVLTRITRAAHDEYHSKSPAQLLSWREGE